MASVLDRLAQVGEKRVGNPGGGVRSRHAEMKRRRQVERVESPPFRDQVVVDVIDVQLGRSEGDEEGRVADHLELLNRRDAFANPVRGLENAARNLEIPGFAKAHHRGPGRGDETSRPAAGQSR